ncbi:MAG TPA: hypothetical protein VH641_05275 [Streptosporangiaceae bacterium]|jgi:hypothetical protein
MSAALSDSASRRAPASLGDPVALLAVWERVAGVPPAARGAAVIAAAGLLPSEEAALDLPIGECAALAARAQAEAFGPVVACTLTCDSCAELLDLELDLAGLPAPPDPVATVSFADGELLLRAPTTRDLVDAAGADDPRRLLVERCVRERTGAGPREAAADGVTADDGPGSGVIAAIDAAVEELAGAAGLVLCALCPGCGADVRTDLDPGQLLWEQVTMAAERLVADVAALAGAYGWTEPDVLALSPARRAAYRQLAGR